jgi:hypothetical protein
MSFRSQLTNAFSRNQMYSLLPCGYPIECLGKFRAQNAYAGLQKILMFSSEYRS